MKQHIERNGRKPGVARGANSQAVEDAIQHAGRNEINALVWHWYAPNCLLDIAEQPWYKGFYTKATCFNVADAVNDSNGANYQLLLRDIESAFKCVAGEVPQFR
ncbi:uncharacterized protein BO97DRAFT_413612 [Aspergillus homomorphus CBS 101889]|uniref:GH26 domain-containing protein n=1 Tax=Aspergillus homomorphus (strain CBS 101889) TaxID=1450537 RepID=A0A395I0F1_ASPHC|nr:hypothetical protein BO97DRAFT_413612 [Aspergillus homomorphus CBS 101889]RAL13159.1 hypothetical protein BO97DRAFT_413612 [Aspergillus homomorphus CBS 101889]